MLIEGFLDVSVLLEVHKVKNNTVGANTYILD